MKSFMLIFSTFLLTTSLFGGVSIGFSVEPENPIAGEEVTFTVTNLEFFCKKDKDIKDEGIGPTLEPGDGSAAITLSKSEEGSYVGTHTYTTAGSFTPSIFCPFSTTALSISGNPVITVSAATAIPTLGEWGLIIMSLIMLGIGMVYLRQRQRSAQRIG